MLREASRLYRQGFRRAFSLTQQMRQQGQTEMDLRFQDALSHLCTGTITRDDWQFFQSRVLSNLSPEEQLQFRDSVVLFSRNVDVEERNMTTLENAGTPVARVEAKYSGPISPRDGSQLNSDDCNGLEHLLHLGVGCRVTTSLVTLFFSLILGHVDEEHMEYKGAVQWIAGHSTRINIYRQPSGVESTILHSNRI
jgi:hypothetical protein